MSSVRGSQCLHQAELFPLSSGPAGGHQGGSPCKLEKTRTVNKHAADELLQSLTRVLVIQWRPGELYVLTNSLTLSHCLLISLLCWDNVQNHSRLYKRECLE